MRPLLWLWGVALTSVLSAQSSTPGPPEVVAYVGNLTNTAFASNLAETQCAPAGCDWRFFDPRTGRHERLWPLPGPPTNVQWDRAFTTVYYRVGDTMYAARWAVGARPRTLFTVPAELAGTPEQIADVWRDRARGAWRLKSVSTAADRSTATLWEYAAKARRWRVLRRAPVECHVTPTPCGVALDGPAASVARVTVESRLERMRVQHHLERLQPGGGSLWQEGRRTFPSQGASGAAIRVGVVVGDSYHAWAPLAYVRPNGEEAVVFEAADGRCSRQLGFQEVAGVLLVGTEFVGACAQVVHMPSGTTLADLSEASANAVWVLPPAGR